MASLFRQRLVERVARDLLGLDRSVIAGWRKVGEVAHRQRRDLQIAAAREGIELQWEDFRGWSIHKEKRAA